MFSISLWPPWLKSSIPKCSHCLTLFSCMTQGLGNVGLVKLWSLILLHYPTTSKFKRSRSKTSSCYSCLFSFDRIILFSSDCQHEVTQDVCFIVFHLETPTCEASGLDACKMGFLCNFGGSIRFITMASGRSSRISDVKYIFYHLVVHASFFIWREIQKILRKRAFYKNRHNGAQTVKKVLWAS